MENLAVLDQLHRDGFSEGLIDRIERTLNAHQGLVDCLKDLAHYCHDQIDETGLQERVRLILTKAEVK